jgi:hypothetical protein
MSRSWLFNNDYFFQHLLYHKVQEMAHFFVTKNVRRMDLTDDRTVDANYGREATDDHASLCQSDAL